jgi:hypothetical protein
MTDVLGARACVAPDREGSPDPDRWLRFHKQSLAAVVDELWRAAARERAASDPRLDRWRNLYRRFATYGVGPRIAPPPSPGLLDPLLGVAWWSSFDATSIAPEPAPSALDPLYRYLDNLEQSVSRKVAEAINSVRPAVFVFAVSDLVRAIVAGTVRVTACHGLERVELPTEVLAARQWRLRRDASLIVYTADGGQQAYGQTQIEVTGRNGTLEQQAVSVSTIKASPKTRPPSVKAQYTENALRAWFMLRIRTWPENKPFPTEPACLAEAKNYFDGVTRDKFRDIRQDMAPPGWRKQGPRAQRGG